MITPLREGTRIGGHVLLLPLARGGMSDVWLARATENGRTGTTVVIKTLPPELARYSEFQEMFRDEGHLAARLDHPNIVNVLDYVEEGVRQLLVMEHVAGRTLRHFMRECRRIKTRVPPWFALQAAVSVCDALEYAHSLCDAAGKPLSIVHRDVTPENIIMTYEGQAKVIDFGVARAADAVARTRAGGLKGKYPYMAPELIEESELGLPPSPAVDVYALGVVLYELLTGVRPFRADNELALIRKITTTVPEPPAAVCPGLPEPLSELVMRAMARSPADRFASAGEMKGAIEDYFLVGGRIPTQRNMGDYVRSLFPVPGDSEVFAAEAPTGAAVSHDGGPTDPWRRDSRPALGSEGGMGIDLSDTFVGTGSVHPGSTCPPPGESGAWATTLPPLPPSPSFAAVGSPGELSEQHGWDAAVSKISGTAAKAASNGDGLTSASHWFDAGLERWRDKDFEGTLACWTQALALDPENRRYQSNLRMLEKHANDRGRGR